MKQFTKYIYKGGRQTLHRDEVRDVADPGEVARRAQVLLLSRQPELHLVRTEFTFEAMTTVIFTRRADEPTAATPDTDDTNGGF